MFTNPEKHFRYQQALERHQQAAAEAETRAANAEAALAHAQQQLRLGSAVEAELQVHTTNVTPSWQQVPARET